MSHTLDIKSYGGHHGKTGTHQSICETIEQHDFLQRPISIYLHQVRRADGERGLYRSAEQHK